MYYNNQASKNKGIECGSNSMDYLKDDANPLCRLRPKCTLSRYQKENKQDNSKKTTMGPRDSPNARHHHDPYYHHDHPPSPPPAGDANAMIQDAVVSPMSLFEDERDEYYEGGGGGVGGADGGCCYFWCCGSCYLENGECFLEWFVRNAWEAVLPSNIRKRVEAFLSPTTIALLTSFTALLIGAIMLTLSRAAAASRAAAQAAAQQRSPSHVLSTATPEQVQAYRTYWTNLRATVASASAADYPSQASVARGGGSGNNNNDNGTTSNLMPLELNIPDTPAWQALDWMTLQDPVQFESLLVDHTNQDSNNVFNNAAAEEQQLQLQEERDRILQRFALVVLYFLSPGIWNLRSTTDGWPAALTDRRPYRFRAATIAATDAVEELDSNVTSVLHECSWLGVTCDDRDRVTGLELSGGEQVPIVLQGTVPVELGLLTDLRTLDLSRQGLRGAFPGEVLYPRWKRLQELRMGMNAFTSMGMMTTTTRSGDTGGGSGSGADEGTETRVVGWKDSLLEVVDWHENHLQDTVPLEALQALQHLRILNLKSNPRLTGPLFLGGADGSGNDTATADATTTTTEESSPPPPPPPPPPPLSQQEQQQQPSSSSSLEQQLWPKLEVLEISSTGTTGTLLQSNMACTRLIKMDVSKTRMSFELPQHIGQCTALKHLTAHSLYAPSLHGTLPNALGGCTALRTLELQYNRIRGTLPSEAMGKLRSLEYLNLEGNRFTGTLPTTLGQMTALEILQVTKNRFNGTPPAELANCHSLQQVFLQRNEFSGIVPPEICKMNLHRFEANCDRSQTQTQPSYNHPFQCSCCACVHGF